LKAKQDIEDLVTAAEAALTEKKGLEEAAKKVWDANKK